MSAPRNTERTRSMGCIATLTDGTRLHTFVTSPAWSRVDAVREIAAECDRRGMYVQTISTPESIRRDLKGSRAFGMTPEPQHLKEIDRLDLSPLLTTRHGSRVAQTKGRRRG